MLQEERQLQILNYIKDSSDGYAEVKELASKFNASPSTIRRDLKNLDEKSMLVRVHGGAMIANNTTNEIKAKEKRLLNKNSKKHIGKIAAKYIFEGESIILDSGTTTLEVSKLLHNFKKITVITYDLRIAIETSLNSESKMIIAGGERRDGYELLYGDTCKEFIKNMNVDKAFLGADAISIEKGITNAYFPEVPIKKQIIKSAKEVLLVADSSKFDKIALVHVCNLIDIDKIITDPKIDKNLFKRIKEMGVDIEF